MNTSEREDLGGLVSLLTRNTPHPVRTEDDAGRAVVRYRMWPSLLGQLQAALTPSMESGSGGSGSGRPSPLALNAFDLLRRIDETSTYQYWTFGGTDRLVATSIAKRIQFWAVKALANPEAEKEATHLISGWCKDIEALFNPQQRIELKSRCPECNLSHYQVEEDGDLIRKPTLTAVPHERGTFASCGNCGVTWSGYQLHALADHVTRVG